MAQSEDFTYRISTEIDKKTFAEAGRYFKLILKGVKSLSKEIKASGVETRALTTVLRQHTKETGKAEKGQKGLEEQTKETTEASNKQSKAVKENNSSWKKSLAGLSKDYIRLTAAITGTTAAVAYFMNNSNKQIDANYKYSTAIGVNYESLQEWQYAAQLAGATSEQMTDAFRELSERTTDAALAGSGELAEAFEFLGLNAQDFMNMPIEERMLAVTDAMRGVSKEQQIFFSEKFFGGQTGDFMVNLVKQSREELASTFAEARAGGGIRSIADAQNAAEYNDAMARLMNTVRGLVTILTVNLTPIMTDLMDQFREWIGANRELVAQNIMSFVQGLSIAIQRLWIGFNNLYKGVSWLVDKLGGFADVVGYIISLYLAFRLMQIGIALVGVAKGFSLAAAAAKVLAMSPLFIAFGLLFLILEDIYTYATGGKSVFGLMIDAFEDLGLALKDTFGFLGDYFGDGFWAGIAATALSGLAALGNIFAAFFNGVIDGINSLTSRFGDKYQLDHMEYVDVESFVGNVMGTPAPANEASQSTNNNMVQNSPIQQNNQITVKSVAEATEFTETNLERSLDQVTGLEAQDSAGPLYTMGN